jgi:hypothetical protein
MGERRRMRAPDDAVTCDEQAEYGDGKGCFPRCALLSDYSLPWVFAILSRQKETYGEAAGRKSLGAHVRREGVLVQPDTA